MSRIIKITLTVNEASAGTVIADLAGRKDIDSFQFDVVQLVDRRSRRAVDGEKLTERVLTALKNGPATRAALARQLQVDGNSVSSALNTLMKKERVQKPRLGGDGKWQLKKKGAKRG